MAEAVRPEDHCDEAAEDEFSEIIKCRTGKYRVSSCAQLLARAPKVVFLSARATGVCARMHPCYVRLSARTCVAYLFIFLRYSEMKPTYWSVGQRVREESVLVLRPIYPSAQTSSLTPVRCPLRVQEPHQQAFVFSHMGLFSCTKSEFNPGY